MRTVAAVCLVALAGCSKPAPAPAAKPAPVPAPAAVPAQVETIFGTPVNLLAPPTAWQIDMAGGPSVTLGNRQGPIPPDINTAFLTWHTADGQYYLQVTHQGQMIVWTPVGWAMLPAGNATNVGVRRNTGFGVSDPVMCNITQIP